MSRINFTSQHVLLMQMVKQSLKPFGTRGQIVGKKMLVKEKKRTKSSFSIGLVCVYRKVRNVLLFQTPLAREEF